MSHPTELEPFDTYNQALVAAVHPPNWVNPTPTGRYNMVVIGAGTAGLVTAAGAAGLGAKVALIERNLMGGDCLNFGCVPSKALIAAAERSAVVRSAGELGIRTEPPEAEFPQIMQRMRQLRASISPHDSAERFKSLGVDVYFGEAVFHNAHHIEVAGQTLQFSKAVIATGARATVPSIPGLRETGFLTNESLFSLTELPPRMVVVGGGPIGCEMAQTFARLGSHVTVIEKNSSILPREEPAAAQIVHAALERDGVQFLLDATIQQVQTLAGERCITVRQTGRENQLQTDLILVSTGRTPNVEGLGLERAGVQFDSNVGIVVDDRLRTTQRHIFAAGDVCSPYRFTHAADFQARIVIQNALFLGRRRSSQLLIPWCTYTRPEIAHVGLDVASAEKRGIAIDTFRQSFADIDRAKLDSEDQGFVLVHCRRRSDRILGATIVGPHAGDLIGQLVLAMQHRIGLGKIASVIHPYPTYAEAIRKLGDQYNRTRLTPVIKSVFGTWLRWTR